MATNNQEQQNEIYEEADNVSENNAGVDNRESSRPRSISQHKERTQTRSRSRTPNNIVAKHWASSNAFINFIKDFRQSHDGLKSTRLFQLAGKRWKEMSTAERQPYVDAAKNVKQKKQNEKGTEQPNTTENNNKEKTFKTGQNLPEKKNKEKKKKSKNESDAESGTSTNHSASTSSMSSLDTSDPD